MIRNLNVDLLYQPLIDKPPYDPNQLYNQSTTGDKVTIDTWRETWLKNYQAAVDRFGSLAEKSVGKLHGVNRHRPMICIGSGPSLRSGIDALKKNKESDHPVPSISCLHNFGFLEDEGCHADYYLSLDSGGVVIDDATESRNKDGNFYWDQTKGKKLLAAAASDPKLFDLWQGEIYLFNSLIPDMEMREKFAAIQRFPHYISAGGNAGGACMYAAKALMSSDPIIYVGYDFCFAYDNAFHAYPTKYDSVGQYVTWVDVYKMPRKTWGSYLNFKFWFDYIACAIPGTWINASEGIMGAYPEGNIKQFRYMSLEEALIPYWMTEKVYLETRDAKSTEVLGKDPIYLKDIWQNPAYEKDLTIF